MIRRARKFSNKAMVTILVCLLICQTFAAVPKSAYAETEPPITYSFKNLGLPGHEAETQPGWTLVGLPSSVPVIRWQLYGANIASGTAASNNSRSFDFDVPLDSPYLIKFSGYWSSGGGIADIKIDGTSIGKYDFFAGPTGYGTLNPIKTVQLSEGTHRLTLTSTGKNANAAGYYMYPSQLVLEKKDSLAALDTVTVTADKTRLIVGETVQSAVYGSMTDGSEADMSSAAISYLSDNETVAAVNSSGAITANTAGTAAITTSVTLDGVTKSASLPVEVLTDKMLQSVTLSMDESELYPGQSAKVSVTGTMNDGTPADLASAQISFTSSDANVAQVDENGNLLTIAAGTAAVSAAVTLNGITKTGSLDIQVNEVTSSKTRSTYYTPAKVEAARQNVEKYIWAKSMKDSATAKADKYVALGLDKLWEAVPPQTLPRSYGVNQKLGSPITGTEINKFGNYPWLGDPINDPWKLTDPSSGYKFPTNDFGAYYRSGLDANGIFQPELADRSLLVNTLYPEKGPTWGVDDGYGWVDENGNRWTFISYYTHWYLWYGGSALIQNALTSFRDAYIYTGDAKYARAGAILLDRVADVYPSLDIAAYDKSIYLNSHGGTGLGKAIGSIWETGLVKEFVSSYDAFFPAMDDPEITSFLKVQGEKYDLPFKNTPAGIKRNIEDGILKQVYPGVKNAQIRGNNGFHQSALAMAAVVYDTLPETKEWLDFNFQAGGFSNNKVTGGNILASLVNDVDRDGSGNEAGPGYNRLWLSTYQVVADILDGYDKYPAADLYRNVKFRKMFSALHPLTLVERYTAQIGDSGSTGNPGLFLNKSEVVKAFEKYGDPVYAQLAHFLNNNRTDGIHGDIFSPDPEKVANDIQAVIQTSGPFDLKSSNLTGYGFTALRDGTKVKYNFGIPYAFPQMNVTEQSKETKIFDSNSSVQFEASEPGDFVTFSFDVPRTDEYEIDLKPYRTTSYGTYNISIDGQQLTEFDFFGMLSEHEPIGQMVLTEGTHQISFENTGKNAASTGYKLGLMELVLLDAAAQAKKDSTPLTDTLRDVWMYYGRNGGHGHRDTLNLGMHAFGLDLAPDLGYPEFADSTNTHRWEWMNNTISHNTVVVDKAKQQTQWVGTPRRFDDSGEVKLIEVEAPQVYPQTELYKRTTAMIKVDDANAYTVDFFRVKGGSDHHFSFHGAEGSVSTEGLSLTPQATGTYAGPDVAYGQRADSVGGTGYMGSGFHYLKNVERDNKPGEAFSVDWDVKDTWNVLKEDADIHLRLTMLGEADDVALADGIPPQNKPGNPASLRYLIAHRTGENLSSVFTSVIEPYQAERFLQSVKPAVVKAGDKQVSDMDARAVKVTLANGRVDYIVSALNPDISYTIDDKIEFKGSFGVYSEKYDKQVYGYVNDGTVIGKIGSPLVTAGKGSISGTIVDFTKELSLNNEMIVQMELSGLDLNDLIGRTIYVSNDGVRNAAYLIKGAIALDGGRFKLDIGDSTTVRSYVDSNDFSKGFIFDLAAGAGFRIPLTYELIESRSAQGGAGE